MYFHIVCVCDTLLLFKRTPAHASPTLPPSSAPTYPTCPRSWQLHELDIFSCSACLWLGAFFGNGNEKLDVRLLAFDQSAIDFLPPNGKNRI